MLRLPNYTLIVAGCQGHVKLFFQIDLIFQNVLISRSHFVAAQFPTSKILLHGWETAKQSAVI